jgi:ABC-type multidrug transport system permease subunit
MYRVSPFTYLISALLSVGLANNAVTCSALETISIQPPSGQTCQQYLGPYMQVAGGGLANPNSTQSCEYCMIADTNVYLASVNSFFDQRWRNLGFLWVYIVFNIFGAMALYWLARVPKKDLWAGLVRRFRPGVVDALH